MLNCCTGPCSTGSRRPCTGYRRCRRRRVFSADAACQLCPCFPALQAGQPVGLIWPPLPRLAYCGLRPWPSLRDGFLRPSAAGIARGGIPLRTPLARVPAEPRLPNPIEHTRPRGIHAPGHSFGVIQTMLLALANFGLERMGREKPQQIEYVTAACGRIFSFGFWFARSAQKNVAGVAATVLSAPIARRNEPSLTGPPG